MAGDRLVMLDLAGTLELIAEEGRGDAVRRRARPGARRARRSEHGGLDHRARPRRVPGHPPPAGVGVVPRPRVLLEPAAVVRRDPDRVRAAAARAARRRTARPAAPTRSPRSRASCASRAACAATTASSARSTAAGSSAGSRRRRSRALGRDRARRRRRSRRPRRRAARRTSRSSTRDGNAAALTVSTGSGSGIVVPGTGVQLNNMLGEFDLPRVPEPGHAALEHDVAVDRQPRRRGARLVVGSAGSLRLRSAVLQVIVNVVGHGLSVEEALERAARPRRGAVPALRGRARSGRASTGSWRWAGRSCAGGAATSTSAVRRRSRCSTTARWPRPATRAAAATASSSSERRERRRRSARPSPRDAAALVELGRAVGSEPGRLADHDRATGAARPTSAATSRRCAGTSTRPSSSPRARTAGSSAGSRSRATSIPRARTSPTSG